MTIQDIILYLSTIEDLRYDGVECPKVATNNTINENVVTRSDIEHSISGLSQHQFFLLRTLEILREFDIVVQVFCEHFQL